MRNRKYAVLVAFALLCGLLVVPAGTAGAIPIFPGNPGDLQVTFDNTGEPGFNTGSPATGVGAFRMDTGAGTGSEAGGKVFLRSTELDGTPVASLTALSFQYFIDPTSGATTEPYFNLRVESPLFEDALGVPSGARTITSSPFLGPWGSTPRKRLRSGMKLTGLRQVGMGSSTAMA